MEGVDRQPRSVWISAARIWGARMARRKKKGCSPLIRLGIFYIFAGIVSALIVYSIKDVFLSGIPLSHLYLVHDRRVDLV